LARQHEAIVFFNQDRSIKISSKPGALRAFTQGMNLPRSQIVNRRPLRKEVATGAAFLAGACRWRSAFVTLCVMPPTTP
jgi:hypothetical protein